MYSYWAGNANVTVLPSIFWESLIGETAQIISQEIVKDGQLRVELKIRTSFFDVNVYLDKNSELLKFKINWENNLENKLWQVRFNFPYEVCEVFSEDMNTLIKREFDPHYNIREHLPQKRGIEARTNTAPMQRFVWINGLGVITKGLTEYEVYKNSLSITLLRSTGIISNPENSARSTPAGPPIEVPGAQQLGKNNAEFAIGFFEPDNFNRYVEEFFLDS